MGLGHIQINDELSKRNHFLIVNSSFLEIKERLQSGRRLPEVVKEIEILLEQEYKQDKEHLIEKLTEEAYALQRAHDDTEARADVIAEEKDRLLLVDYQQESVQINNRSSALIVEISQLKNELAALENQIMIQGITHHTHAATHHSHEHVHIHVHNRAHTHGHHHHSEHTHGIEMYNQSVVYALQGTWLFKKERIKALEQELKSGNNRLAQLADLKGALERNRSNRQMQEKQRLYRNTIRNQNKHSLAQLSKKGKQDLDDAIKSQVRLLDEQLQDLKHVASRESYPNYLESLEHILNLTGLIHIKPEEQEALKQILESMKMYSSSQKEVEELSIHCDNLVREKIKQNNLIKGNSNKVQSNSLQVQTLNNQNKLLLQEEPQLHHLVAVANRKKNFALYCSLGVGVGAVASFAAVIFFIMNPLLFLVPSILVLATVSLLIVGASFGVQKSNLEDSIDTNANKMRKNKYALNEFEESSEKLNRDNRVLADDLVRLEQQILKVKEKLSTSKRSRDEWFQKAQSAETPYPVTQYNFFPSVPTPSAPPLLIENPESSNQVTPY